MLFCGYLTILNLFLRPWNRIQIMNREKPLNPDPKHCCEDSYYNHLCVVGEPVLSHLVPGDDAGHHHPAHGGPARGDGHRNPAHSL